MAETLMFVLFVCHVTVLTGVLNGTSAQSNLQNVALNKACNISTMHSSTDMFSNPCGAANNGNTSTEYVDGNCIHTDLNDPHPEWTVHLGQDYVIQTITIYARDEWVIRMSDVNVTINNNVVKTFPRCVPSDQDNCGFTAGRFDITVSPPVVGNTVTLEGPAHERADPFNYIRFLNICEVQVWECDDHHYGYNCSQHCSAGCDGEMCDNVNGHCDVTTCLPGYLQTPPCDTECDRHHYGTNCSHHCSAGCEGQTCDGATGHCDVSTCWPGYLQSPKCDQECPDGTYGTNCSQPCGQGCDPPDSCNKTNGGCVCLSANWEIERCAECGRGHYNKSSSCENTCGRGCQADMCSHDNGMCTCKDQTKWETPFCRDCADGHYGDDCDQTCGHCAHSEVCSKTDGRCPAACDGDYIPPYCTPSKETSDGDSNTSPIVGSVVGVGLFVGVGMIILAVAIWKRKSGPTQHHSQPTPKDSGPGFTESNVDLAPPARGSASTTHTVGVTAAAHRDEDTEEHYVKIDDVTPASHDTQYYNTEGSNPQYHNTEVPSTGHYHQLTVQYENTGDVRPYQQWSVSRDGQYGSDTRTA